MYVTFLLGNGSRVARHCTAVFTNQLFKIQISNGAAGIKEAAPKRRKVIEMRAHIHR